MSLKEAIVPVTIIVVSLLTATVLITILLRALGVDLATAILASSPGDISQMGAIAADLGANAPVVVTAHLIRVITVVIFAPLVAKFLVK